MDDPQTDTISLTNLANCEGSCRRQGAGDMMLVADPAYHTQREWLARGACQTLTFEQVVKELASYMRGWVGYFGFCETPEVLIALTRWVRLRLRAALWRQWKTPRRRRAALIALGVKGRLASNTAGSGLGPWHLARSKALSVGLSNKYFRSLGLPSLFGTC